MGSFYWMSSKLFQIYDDELHYWESPGALWDWSLKECGSSIYIVAEQLQQLAGFKWI